MGKFVTGPSGNLATAPLILQLDSPQATELSLTGGKGRGLARLIQAGFRVPPGYVITTAAYVEFASQAGIAPLLSELANVSPQDKTGLSAIGTRLRDKLLAQPLPDDIAESIISAYQALGPHSAVAVRSSATAEDLAAASFAGQQETLLNIRGSAALVLAVRSVFASLWSERAIVYRAAIGVPLQALHLAVVVQRMIDPRVAGVLFTANPLTGRRHQAVIDAAFGLGESVVSGLIDPDHFVIDMNTGAVCETKVGNKQLAVRAQSAGGVEQIAARKKADLCINTAEIHELAAIGTQVEQHFGCPQDIEFAYDRTGQLYLTQTRPITTLFPLPSGSPAAANRLRVYLSATADEGLTRPITPMGIQCIRLMAAAWQELLRSISLSDPAAGPDFVVEAASRIYYDITAVCQSHIGRRLARHFLQQLDVSTAAQLQVCLGDARLVPTKTPLLPLIWGLLLAMGKLHLPLRLPLALISPEFFHASMRRRFAQALEQHKSARDDTTLADVVQLERWVFACCKELPVVSLIEPTAGYLALALAKLLLGSTASEQELQTVLLGLVHIETTEINLAVAALAEQMRGDGAAYAVLTDQTPSELAVDYARQALPAVLQTGLAKFLRRYGHRAVAEVDLGLPRWAEDPRHILEALRNDLNLGSLSPMQQHERAHQDATAMVRELSARGRLGFPFGRLRSTAVKFLLLRAQALLGRREQWKDDLCRIFAGARHDLARVGQALVAAARLERAADIYFLSLAEVREGFNGTDLRQRVAERQDSYEHELQRRHIPAVLLSDGTEPHARPGAEIRSDDLQGTPVSPGCVRGRARVLHDTVGAHIEAGEILVVSSLDPGWTPLFASVAGLVMEKGGSVSHGAIIAREYGIPAVVSVPDAMTKIASGQLVEVDGAKGSVRLIKVEPPSAPAKPPGQGPAVNPQTTACE